MAKVLRIAAIVVAIAAAIPSGGTSLLGAGLGVSAGTASLIATGIGIASSLVTSLTAKPPAIEGGQTEWQSDPNGPAPIVFGDTLVAPSLVLRKTGGKKNTYQHLCGVLSGCGPIQAIDATLADGEQINFSGDTPTTGEWHKWLRQVTQIGATPEAIAMGLGWGALSSSWTSASKLSGYAAVMSEFKFDGKDGNSPPFTQIPRMQYRLRGVKCYDPRQDSTYPGGSGSQRHDDQATWAFSQNPWVQAITFALGWRHGPNSIRVGGVGMPVTAIDLPAYVEAANVADANGWKSGGRVFTTDPKWEVLKSLCQAGGGEPVRLGATLSCTVNTPRVSIGTIRRGDVIGNASITTTQTRRDRLNGIIPKYRSEDHFFEQVPAGVVRNTTYLAQDGGIERTRDRTYPMVQCYAGDTPDQAAQLAAYDLANAREAGPIVFPLKLRWLGYRAGDCLTIEDTPEFGYMAGRNVIVLRRQLDPETAGVMLTMREETAAKHTWALGLTGSAAPTTSANAPPVDEAPDVGDWTISTRVDTLEGLPTGTIRLTGAVSDTTAGAVTIEYRVSGDVTWIESAVLSHTATLHEIRALDVARTYDVAIRYDAGPRLIALNNSFNTTTADTTQVTADNAFLTADRA